MTPSAVLSDKNPRPAGRGFAVRLSLYYAAFFLVIGVYLPFMPLWLDSRGLTAPEIAVVLGLPMLIRVIATPVLTFAADRGGYAREAIIGFGWIVTGSFIGLAFVDGFLAILLITVVSASFWHPIMAITEGIAQDGSKRLGVDYGLMRLWGSVSFIAANLIGGAVVGAFGGAAVLSLVIACGVAMAVLGHAMPGAISRPAATLGLDLRGYRRMLGRAGLVIFVFGLAAVHSAHALYYSFGTLHWESLGYSAIVIGGLWALGVLAEIVLFAVSGRVLAWLGVRGLVIAATVATVLRWSLLAFDPPFALVIVAQIGHALTFGAAHLATVTMMAEVAPEGGKSSAQALFFTISGAIMGGLVLVSGPLYAALAGQAYLAMAFVGGIGGLAALHGLGRLSAGQPRSMGASG